MQEQLRDRVVAEDRFGTVTCVAGLDVHYAPRTGLTWAAVAILSFPDLVLQESVLACVATRFPYVPGLLSFCEAPAMLLALANATRRPDLLMVDGQGLAHPRRFGLACHVGVLSGLPSIGVAKSRLVGRHADPAAGRGAWQPLIDKGETIGAVLRSRAATKPVYVSVGHRVGLESAIDLVLRCAPRFRVPEPVRIADRLSRMHP